MRHLNHPAVDRGRIFHHGPQRLYELKMADGENILVGACSSTPDMDEPVSKRQKISMAIECGLKIVQTEQVICGAEAGERWAEVALARPEERGVEPVMAVEQAPAALLGADNGQMVLEPHGRVVKVDKTTVDGLAEEQAEPLGQDGALSPNGLATSDCANEDDDRSSHASSSDWTPQPQIGSYSFIQQHIMRETDPRTILKDLLPETVLPPDLDDMTLWQIIINISEPPKRKKRKDINTLEDVVRLLHESKKILVLTGAGVSVSCGIPDFRSRDGIYARLAVDFPDLPDPQAMFDIEYFRRDPRPFFKFAKEIYPGQFQPSPCHKFISMLDKQGKLLRNYTQNIDTLEQVAGVQRIIQCHGSFATASCLVCKHKVDCEAVREDIFNQVVPHCPRCPDIPLAIMKPDIVFFGENLPEFFHRAMKQDKDEVDLLIVIGSSLKVRPVALIPNSIPHEVPQILINREQLPHLNFDVELLGDCDVIINELCHRLAGDFEQLCYNTLRLNEITEKPPRLPTSTEQPLCEALPSTHSEQIEEQKQQNTEVKSSEDSGTQSGKDVLELSPGVSPGPCPKAQSLKDDTLGRSESQTVDPQPEEVEQQEGLNDQNLNREIHRRCWMSRVSRSPISKRLEKSQYLFQAPNHYIFHGAEVCSDSEDETSSSCGSDSEDSCCSADGMEDEEEDEEEDEDSEAEEPSMPAVEGEGCHRDTQPHKQANKDTLSVQTNSTAENIKSTTNL
ncbi:NAD-dependent protein deacetylase sirtuin-1 [Osmerus eperlanus]|uniref:NAD-dependent protein deacetylase sirtuin-1 n=1 Tax=Osmerus eperlanus TaxID=29151 RepID=UPI002E151838